MACTHHDIHPSRGGQAAFSSAAESLLFILLRCNCRAILAGFIGKQRIYIISATRSITFDREESIQISYISGASAWADADWRCALRFKIQAAKPPQRSGTVRQSRTYPMRFPPTSYPVTPAEPEHGPKCKESHQKHPARRSGSNRPATTAEAPGPGSEQCRNSLDVRS